MSRGYSLCKFFQRVCSWPRVFEMASEDSIASTELRRIAGGMGPGNAYSKPLHAVLMVDQLGCVKAPGKYTSRRATLWQVIHSTSQEPVVQ